MAGIWFLARRYLAFHRGRTGVLAIGIALTLFLPVALQLFVHDFRTGLLARAEATPLVCGAPGSRYDLVLSTLYFEGRVPRPLRMASVDALRESNLGLPVPVLLEGTAGGFPLVGTDLDYFDRRATRVARGSLPRVLGDVVLGSLVAADLDLEPGDSLLSDEVNLYDLSSRYPLRMHVSGVLSESDSPDDRAVFCDLRTAWIARGLGHGHDPAESQSPGQVATSTPDGVVLNPSVVTFTEITDENRGSFHFHEGRELLPVTGILVFPVDARAATLLKGRYRVDADAQLLVPTEVMNELMGFVLRIKAFFDANALLVLLAVLLFLSVIVTLSIQARRPELATYERIGSARGTVVRLLVAEFGMIVAAGVVLAGLGTGVLALWLQSSGGLL